MLQLAEIAPSQVDRLYSDLLFDTQATVDFTIVVAGVFLAELVAYGVQLWIESRALNKTRQIVRSSLAIGIGNALLGVWRHSDCLEMLGAPGDVGLPSGFHTLDPFRVTETLGSENYALLLACGTEVDLLNEWLRRQNSELVAAINSVQVPVNGRAFTQAFYRDKRSAALHRFAIAERDLSALLERVAPNRLMRLRHVDRSRLRADLEARILANQFR